MKEGLQEINELEGVWGSLICDNQGEIIASAPPPGFEQSGLEEISRLCVETLSDGSEYIPGLGEMVFFYQQKHLFVLDLKKVVMIVFCTPKIDISLLRMSINVVTSRWEGEQKI
jgi:predicted regulator of Ras-like GTPase activity (Roadblock/LC7/MglB family)